MANDLLSVQDERYKYSYTGNNNQTLSKEVLLNDTDPLYRRLKHMHIAELSTQLHAEYKAFLENNKSSAALSKGNAGDVRAMAEGLKAMPKFQEETARYSLHIHVVGELLKRFNETCLEEVSGLEQDLACGEDAQQKPFKTALADLRALLGRTDLPLSPEDRIRLLMMFVISQDGIQQEQRRELMELADVTPEDQLAVLNLFYMGVTLLQGSTARKKKAGRLYIYYVCVRSPLRLGTPPLLYAWVGRAEAGRRGLRRVALRAAAQAPHRGHPQWHALARRLPVHQATAGRRLRRQGPAARRAQPCVRGAGPPADRLRVRRPQLLGAARDARGGQRDGA